MVNNAGYILVTGEGKPVYVGNGIEFFASFTDAENRRSELIDLREDTEDEVENWSSVCALLSYAAPPRVLYEVLTYGNEADFDTNTYCVEEADLPSLKVAIAIAHFALKNHHGNIAAVRSYNKKNLSGFSQQKYFLT